MNIQGHGFWGWESDATIIEKSENSRYEIRRAQLRGKEYVTIREWYRTKQSPEWMPSRQGISIPVQLANAIGSVILAVGGG